jgi:catalase
MISSESNRVSRTLASQLSSTASITRLTAIGFVLVAIAALFAYAGGWLTPHALTPAALINTFEQVNGVHPGFRRNHAKGICVTGYFESSGDGHELSRASVFLPGRVPIVGRFALSGGQPYVSDAPQTVRSLAILFKLPDGEEWRTAMINLPVFTVNTAQGFNDLLLASAPNRATGKPDPAAMNAFLAKHPETAAATQLIRSQPPTSGFADTTYNALHAFRFTNTKGAVSPVRWSMVPVRPPATADAAKTGKNYLFDDLIADLHHSPLSWRLILTVGQPGDATADATIPWPSSRHQIDAGTLTIDHIESEDTSPTRDINFDPLVLPDGISASDDPLLSARSAAYSQSFTRREGEQKSPSALSSAEVGK